MIGLVPVLGAVEVGPFQAKKDPEWAGGSKGSQLKRLNGTRRRR